MQEFVRDCIFSRAYFSSGLWGYGGGGEGVTRPEAVKHPGPVTSSSQDTHSSVWVFYSRVFYGAFLLGVLALVDPPPLYSVWVIFLIQLCSTSPRVSKAWAKMGHGELERCIWRRPIRVSNQCAGNERTPHWSSTYLCWVSHCLMSQLCEIMRYVRTIWEYCIPKIARRSRRHLTHTVSHSAELVTERPDGTGARLQPQGLREHQRGGGGDWVRRGREGRKGNRHHSSARWSYIHKHRQRSIAAVSSDSSIRDSELWNTIQRVSVW